MEDRLLLRRYAQDADEAAFRELVRRHAGMVYAACRRQLRDPHLAEDATQAVFIILARKAKAMDQQVILSAWLYRTAGFACANARNLEKTRAYHEGRLCHEKQVSPMADHDHQLDRAASGEIETLIDRGLTSLTASQRDVLVLRFFEGKSIAQISTALKITTYAAEKRLDQGLAALRRFLSQRGVTVSVVALAAWLTREAVAQVPQAMATGMSASAIAAGHGPIAGTVGRIVTGTLREMLAGKIKLAMAAGLVASLVLGVTAALGLTVSAHYSAITTPPPAVAAVDPDLRDLYAMLRAAENALRTMDLDALDRLCAFEPAQRNRWLAMANVFRADLRLKHAAEERFGSAGERITVLQTFARRLDDVLPEVDLRSARWNIHGGEASAHFDYLGLRADNAPGATLYFVRRDGAWRIDAARSVTIAIEGLDPKGHRVPLDQLPPAAQAAVLDKIAALAEALDAAAAGIESGHFATLADARAAIAAATDPIERSQARAFFHLELRFDDHGDPRLSIAGAAPDARLQP